jgi:hypothetical protein
MSSEGGKVAVHCFRQRFQSGSVVVGSFLKTPTVHATEIFECARRQQRRSPVLPA